MSATSAIAARLAPATSVKISRRQYRTRDRILAEGARLFLARGFSAVSVDQLVDAAEIARSSFYRFFANREEVLANIIRPVFEDGLAMMRELEDRPAAGVVHGILDMYLLLWSRGADALRLATRMGGAHFRLFEDLHRPYREALTAQMQRAEPAGILANDSGADSARLIARCAVPVLEVYAGNPRIESLFRQTMTGLLLKPETRQP